MLAAESARVAVRVSEALTAVVEDHLVSAAAYGSAATGDVLAGCSEFDLLVVLKTPLRVGDPLALQDRAGSWDLGPFSCLQPTFLATDEMRPYLVPGGFELLTGSSLPVGWLHDAGSLAKSGAAVLNEAPDLLRRDAADWALAGPAQYERRARLHLTRVKPVLRALAARDANDVVGIWQEDWERLAVRVGRIDPALEAAVGELRRAASRRDHRQVAVSAPQILKHALCGGGG